MSFRFLDRASARTIPIVPIETAVFEAWRKAQPKSMRDWVASVGFKAGSGETSLVAALNLAREASSHLGRRRGSTYRR